MAEACRWTPANSKLVCLKPVTHRAFEKIAGEEKETAPCCTECAKDFQTHFKAIRTEPISGSV